MGTGIAAIAAWQVFSRRGHKLTVENPDCPKAVRSFSQGWRSKRGASSGSFALVHGPWAERDNSVLADYCQLFADLGVILPPLGRLVTKSGLHWYLRIPFESLQTAFLARSNPSDGHEVDLTIWATGLACHFTPFDWLPFKPARGVWLETELPENWPPGTGIQGQVTAIEDRGSLLLGSTASWSDFSLPPQRGEISLLLDRFAGMYSMGRELTPHAASAGIRPASHDRLPYLGQHPEQSMHYCLNGLGALGFSRAFEAARILSTIIDNSGTHLSTDHPWNITRITAKYYQARL